MKLYDRISQALRLPLAGPVFRLYAPRRRWTGLLDDSRRLRILLLNLMPSLGDTICYMAALEHLRAAQPDAEITLLADSTLADFVSQHPALDKVLKVTTSASWMQRIPSLKTYYRLLTIMRSIQRMELDAPFDIAVVLRGGADPSFSAHAVWMLRLPRSIGFSYTVEPDESWHNFGETLLGQVAKTLLYQHEAARPIQLFQEAGLLANNSKSLNLSAPLAGLRSMAARLPLETLLKIIDAPDKPFVVLAPGASVRNRTWPNQNFRALRDLLVHHTSINVIVIGGAAEQQLCEKLLTGSNIDRVYNSAGKLDLLQLAALLSHATAFVGNDSGAGHLAGALGVPAVSLHTQALDADPWHVRSPGKGHPLGPNVTVLRPRHFLAPCSLCCEADEPHCITQITVDEVWQSLKRLL